MGWQRVGHDWVTKHSTCFSVHGILPARILELVDMPSSRGYSQPRDWPHISSISCIVGGFFTAEPLGSLGYGPWGRKELNRTEHAHTFVLWVFSLGQLPLLLCANVSFTSERGHSWDLTFKDEKSNCLELGFFQTMKHSIAFKDLLGWGEAELTGAG